MNEGRETIAWRLAVAAFFCLALWPIWSVRFPALQDYPQHLFQAEVLRDHNDPAFDYGRCFEFRLRPPYATFYLTTLLFSMFAAIETAGKLSLSLYPILVTTIVIRLARRLGKGAAPWGVLIFYPLAFNQQYFLGNINYVLSVPILILALLDFEDFLGDPAGAWPMVRHFLWQFALFMTHPFTFQVYFALALIPAGMAWRKLGSARAKVLVSLGAACLFLAFCLAASREAPSGRSSAAGWIAWASPKLLLEFFGMMFTGMQRFVDADPLVLVLWAGVFAIVIRALIVDGKNRSSLPVPHIAYLGATVIGLVALPFRIGTYTYINVRVTVIIYFLMALLVTRVRMQGWWRYGLAGLLGSCMLLSIAKQARISAEVSEIVPVVERIPPNSRILPLVFDRGSAELDRSFFDAHLHDHNYYHILVGGGFNPYLFRAPIYPVHYKKEAQRPAPGEYYPYNFRWEIHAADYEYFLVRGAPERFVQYLAGTCNLITVSGHWMLFERKSDQEIQRRQP